jgi:hypothetical protein
MRPAIFSTDEPPQPITCVETLEYVQSLRRRIEVQNDLGEHLSNQVLHLLAKNRRLEGEVEKLALDLGVMDGGPGVGWVKAPR